MEVKDIKELKGSKTSKHVAPTLVGVISLGCDKNRVDSEVMLTYLLKANYKFTSNPANADVLIVNTCGFIKSARDESMEAINEMSEFRKNPNARCKRLIVTGCMPQRWLNEMREEFPEVDVFLGIDQYPDIVKIIENSLKSEKKIIKVGTTKALYNVKDRVITTPKHYAYLKIADGCDNFCTFCTIPYIRGHYRSRDLSDIVDEAKSLVENGATELILVAQDVSRYGIDKAGKPQLVKLIQELSKIEKLRWIRLLYIYPEMVTDELLNEIVENPKLCKYLDIPMQHVSDKILKKMNRRTTRADLENIIDKIKKLPVFVAIRTTFMVGFPGESEEDFAELANFIKHHHKLMHVGFFAYSKEEGTAAAMMPEQVDEEVKTKRILKLMKLQRQNVAMINAKFVGKTIKVVYEGIDYKRQLFFGRNEFQTPEVDTIVYFKTDKEVKQGEYYDIKITKVRGYDLQGEMKDED